MLVDSVLVIVVLLCSFSIRLDYLYFPKDELFWIIFGAPLIAVPIFISFKLYHSIIRYIGSSALWSIFQAITLYAVIWGLLNYMVSIGGIPGVIGIPRSVILINWMLKELKLTKVQLKVFSDNFI